MLVLLNPAAGGGSAARRWDAVARELAQVAGPFTVRRLATAAGAGLHVESALAAGERHFVAAGGDGTLNLLVNTLLTARPLVTRGGIAVGAVGLGSSNDFHKSAPAPLTISSRPCRVDFARSSCRDVGVVEYQRHPDAPAAARYWLLNASIGVTADGNRRYSSPSPLLRRLKQLSPSAAMVGAAAAAVLRYRPLRLRLHLDDHPPMDRRIANLGIVKHPHFTGCLRYPGDLMPRSGRFGVHVLEAVGRVALLRAMVQLARGRFQGSARSSGTGSRLLVESSEPFALETDGEVTAATTARFSILRGALRVCP